MIEGMRSVFRFPLAKKIGLVTSGLPTETLISSASNVKNSLLAYETKKSKSTNTGNIRTQTEVFLDHMQLIFTEF